jgi:hypothetical protein
MSNLRIWNKVKQPDVRYVKDFQRKGGFSGKAINAAYNHLQATEMFGPMGIGWGVDIIDEQYVEGATIYLKDDKGKIVLVDGRPVPLGEEIVHVVRIRLWYIDPETGQRGEVYNYGQTYFVEDTRNGPKTDEEAPKKSLTDAVSKALSNLGFNAEIHLGLWDDNKYVAQVRAEQAKVREDEKAPVKEVEPKPQEPTPPAKQEGGIEFAELAAQYEKLSPSLRNIVAVKFAQIAQKYGAKKLKEATPEAWAEAMQVLKELAP